MRIDAANFQEYDKAIIIVITLYWFDLYLDICMRKFPEKDPLIFSIFII